MRAPVCLTLLLAAAPALAEPNPAGPRAAEDGASAEDTFQLSLEEAYKKELAFLLGQKRQLAQRLDKAERDARNAEAGLESEIARLETRLLSLDESLQSARERAGDVDQAAQSAGDEADLVDSTLEQARQSLADNGGEVPPEVEGSEPAAEVGRVFDAAAALLRDMGRIREVPDAEMFLADGRKTTGTVIHVGRVAAFGVGEAGAGALAPAGGGKLKIWPKPAADTARALLSDESPDRLALFLYESLDSRVEEEAEETVYDHVDDGGVIAWVIVGLGGLGLLLSILRAVLLARGAGNAGAVERELAPLVREGRLSEAAEAAGKLRGAPARVTGDVFSALSESPERTDEAISEAMLGESQRLQRFGTTILVIAAVAPLLGLLGTVTGMISTFDVITKFGTGDPKMLSGGISTALITTELGLIVAIPTLLLGNLLKGWAEGIEAESERAALRLVTLLSGDR